MSQTTSGPVGAVPLNRPDPHAADKADINATAKRRRSRSPSVAKPAFIIMQVLGENGQPALIDKKRIKIIAVERSAEKVLESVESGEHTNAFYLRVVVPAGSRAGIPNKPKDAAA